jgi:hypothetical protein
VKTGAELDERGDPAFDVDGAAGRLGDPATSFSAVLLPEPLRPITP